MPIYEYICQKCSNRFALLQSLSPEDKNTECPKCSSKEVKKALSSFSCGASGSDFTPSMPSSGFGGGGG